MADIVFLMDGSGSGDSTFMEDWIKEQVFAGISGSPHPISQALAAKQITDVRYGLIGFADLASSSFAHSYIVDPGGADPLFGNADQVDAAFENFAVDGDGEDGWDAFEHLIAEYKFRDGAVPVVILLQNQQGRNHSNTTLVREGLLAALQSKNVLVNTVIYGSTPDNFTYVPVFDLTPYGGDPNVRILGVEADAADNVPDGRHNLAGINTNTRQLVASAGATQGAALQVSYNGSNTGASGMVDTGKSILFSKTATSGLGASAAGYKATSVPLPNYRMDIGATTITAGSAVALPFSFNYYGTAYTKAWVSVDGTIRFGNASDPGDPGGENVDLSRSDATRPASPVIAPLWDNLKVTLYDVLRTRNFDYDGNGQNDFGIEWTNFAYDNGSDANSIVDTPNRINFQVVLYADGRIQFNYVDITAGVSGSPFVSGGISATVGLWSGNPDNVNLPADQYVPGLHSIFGASLAGSSSGTLEETNDRYVRLAWDTGGAAWDLGAIDGIGLPIDPNLGGVDPQLLDATRNSMRDAFLTSLGNQVKRRADHGDTFRSDVVVAAFNYGGGSTPAITAEGFTQWTIANTKAYNATTTSIIDVNSNAIPLIPNSANKVQEVFKSARALADAGGSLTHTVTTLPSGEPLPNGTYIVELLFARYSTGSEATMDVAIEGTTVLHDYRVGSDFAKLVRPGDAGGDSSGTQYFVTQAGALTGVVKRFQVDVTGSTATGDAGLQLVLRQTGAGNISISGMRILRADPVRVEDVVVKGSTWAPGVEYSFAALVGAGQQLRPIPTANANTIEVHFDGPVTMTADALTLVQSELGDDEPTAIPGNSGFQFQYDPVNYIARWTYSAGSLVDGKYAILLDAGKVTGSGGAPLDGDWTSDFGYSPSDPDKTPTPDVYSDDAPRPFVVGDGKSGATEGYFRLNFALLAGDGNGDGEVTAADLAATGQLRDFDGNGVIEAGSGSGDMNAHTANLTHALPLRVLHGTDLIDDEIVDGKDLAHWRMIVFLTGQGDVDGDSDTDGDDFVLWQSLFGNISAWWYEPPMATAALMSDSIAPRVANVIVSGSASLHAPFAFDTVDGSGLQVRTVPVGAADTISIVFSEGVNVAAEDLIVVGMTTFNLPELAEFSYDGATHVATWRFEGWALGHNYLLALSDAVTDLANNRLDGEWTNPASFSTVNSLVSEFPSGDGTAGGWFKFALTLMPGDANLDGAVDQLDFSILSANYGPGLNKLFTQADFNGDGVVGPNDLSILSANWNRNLQSPVLMADFDGDWDVDDDDLELIADNAGLAGATWADGDLDGDGEVTLDDLNLAYAHHGMALAVVS
ncbi:MAG: hypothetical protein IT424_11820 [Pirellulales bacterium]|nr:hypothetical protein [Pirellulales bacterium]